MSVCLRNREREAEMWREVETKENREDEGVNMKAKEVKQKEGWHENWRVEKRTGEKQGKWLRDRDLLLLSTPLLSSINATLSIKSAFICPLPLSLSLYSRPIDVHWY
jgi:hypothetical protein